MSPRDLDGDLLPAARVAPAPPRLPGPVRPSVLLLIGMTGLGPFGMQIVIPSLPAIAAGLSASYAAVQLSLTLYLVGVACGQLLYGPLSDRFGRRPLVLVGLALFVLGALAAAASPNVEALIAARIVQAIGGCAGLVLGRAIIRDAWPRDKAAATLGLVSTAMAVAPMLAPLLGSLLEEAFGWRASLLACALGAAPLLLAVAWRLPETNHSPIKLPGLTGLAQAYGSVARSPLFRAHAAIMAFSTAAFFAFAAGSPLVAIGRLGEAPTTFAVAMIAISAAWMAGTWTAAKLSARWGGARMLSLGTGVTLAGGLLAAGAIFLPPSLPLLFLPMAVIAVGNGISQPNAIAGALGARPQLAGTASGLMGAVQMGGGAIATVIVGAFEGGGGAVTFATMCAAGIGTRWALRGTRSGGG